MTNRSPSPEIGLPARVFFPGQAARIATASVGLVGVRGDADVGVRGRRVLEPGELVVEQRLAEPVVVEPRQPLRLREEVVDAAVGFDRDRLVVERALEAHAGELVLVVVPFVLVVLLEERAVADPADFALHGPVVEQAADEVLAMVPERAAAEVFFGHDVAAVEAEVVEAVVVDEPGVGAAGGRADELEERVAGVFDAGAEAEAALAEVIEVEVPLDAFGRLDAEELKGVELEQRLEAEDRVVADADVVDVVARLLEVGGERGPVEDGHAADVDEVVLALRPAVVVDDRLAGAGSTSGSR